MRPIKRQEVFQLEKLGDREKIIQTLEEDSQVYVVEDEVLGRNIYVPRGNEYIARWQDHPPALTQDDRAFANIQSWCLLIEAHFQEGAKLPIPQRDLVISDWTIALKAIESESEKLLRQLESSKPTSCTLIKGVRISPPLCMTSCGLSELANDSRTMSI